MKLDMSRALLCCLLGCTLATIGAAQGPRGRRGAPPPAGPPAQGGVYTTLSGSIAQFNYDRDAEVEGFLLKNNTLVHLPPRVAQRLGTSMHAGDTVQITGYAQISPAGMQTIEAVGVQDRTSGKSFSVPQPGGAAPYSASGRIQQLNYGRDGAVDGLLFDNGTFAAIPPFSAANPTSIRVGATIAFTGYARSTISGRTVVDVQTLTINGQPLALGMVGPERGPGAPPPPPAGPRGSVAPPPPDPAAGGPAAPSIRPAPAGRTDEPPPPPPPAQQPRF